LPFEYFNNNDPEYVLFVVSSAGTVATDGTEAYFDDFEFIYNPVTIDLEVFLEGPYKKGAREMSTDLNPDLIPLEQPFDRAPWNYFEDDTLEEIPSDDVVDWCLVEVRDANTVEGANIFTRRGRQAALLLKNGKVVGLDGSSKLTFDIELYFNIYVIIWHRNHLGAISAYPLAEEDGVHVYNYSDAADKIYGGSQGNTRLEIFSPALWGMASGDGDANKVVNMDDKTNFWSVFVGKSGYLSSDYNMDGQISNQDKNDRWQSNLDKTSQVPN